MKSSLDEGNAFSDALKYYRKASLGADVSLARIPEVSQSHEMMMRAASQESADDYCLRDSEQKTK